MRKIDRSLENPIDNVLLDMCEYISPALRSSGHTPNILTTYSLITGVLSAVALYKGRIGLFVVLYMLSYFFDCADGHYARKYDMVTRFGDLYDHIKDASVSLLIAFIIYKRYKPLVQLWMVILFVILFILMNVHMGCQQKNMEPGVKKNGVETETLDSTIILCRQSSWIHVTKYFGVGTFQILTILLTLYLEYKLHAKN
jgi:hypothetical protein